ncbi:MAG: hypothetical protein M3P98_03840 [bacterium]|nr:hypothetical protein [bacterium]
MNQIPEFREPTLEAFEACIEIGAVKFPQVLPAHSEVLLRELKFSTCVETVNRLYPFFAQVAEMLKDSEMIANVDFYETYGPEYASAHQDSVTRMGLTILAPFEAKPITFVVGDESFEVSEEEAKADPTLHTTSYGVGDVIMLRQEVIYLNLQRVKKQQAFHAAYSYIGRKFFAVDYVSPFVLVGQPIPDLG